MNNMDQILKLLDEANKERCKRADENFKNGIPDPLNDLVDYIIKNEWFKKYGSKLKKNKT